jgi:lipopolysaccharide exporter
VTTVFAALLMPACWGAAGASRQVILVVLGPTWAEAIPVFAVLAAAAPFTFLATLSGVMSEVSAALNPKLVLCLGRLAVLLFLLVAASPLGVVGCALAYAVEEFLAYAAYFVLMRTVLATTFRELVTVQLRGYAVGIVMVLLTGTIGWLGTAGHLPLWLTLLSQIIVGFVGLVWFTLRGFSGATWAALRSGLRWSDRLEGSTHSGRFLRWLDGHSAAARSPGA